MNYAFHVVAGKDKPRALQILKDCSIKAESNDLRSLAMSDYALLLASIGGIDEAVKVAEEAFALRAQSMDPTCLARAYVDLGELYHVAGRKEAAFTLISEGIHRLREVGIQDMLLDQLIFLSDICLSEETVDWPQVGALLEEANSIATRIGARRQTLSVSRMRLTFSSRLGDRRSMLASIEELFKLIQAGNSRTERELALKTLATELDRHGKHEYANAVYLALGQPREGSLQTSWAALLGGDSHSTICVLAVVMSKEALSTI